MLDDILYSIIDSRSIVNIELLEALKGNIDKKQFTIFFDNLKFEDRSNKKIFIKNNILVSTYGDNDINNTFTIFKIDSDNPINYFISGMKDWHKYEIFDIPF